jgi:integrase
MWAYPGNYLTGCALKLSAMLFQRPGEVRKMEWAHVDLDEARWLIPGENMKMREDHLIPLPSQAVSILRDVRALTGDGQYVFPNSQREGGTEPTMSENTVNMAIRRLKDDNGKSYAGRHSAHGFRATARTILDERLGYRPEIIEAQLAHRAPGPLGATYARAKFLDDRRKMVQQYANYLDGLRAGSNVTPIRRSKSA